jgi:hypothetical protein
MFRLRSGTKGWKNFIVFSSSKFRFSWAKISSFVFLAAISVLSEAKKKEK